MGRCSFARPSSRFPWAEGADDAGTGLNYRHQFHAGNFADVVKHVVLGVLFAGMRRKEKPFLFLDTHAGRGKYDLQDADWGRSLPRKPESPQGIGRLLLAAAQSPPPVQAYLSAVTDFDRRCGNLSGSLRFYPGSPWLARSWTRPQDRLVLCELNQVEHEVLAREFRSEPRVAVFQQDGYASIRAFLPPPEKRALVLIDPPFEASTEWESLLQAMEEILRRMPATTIAVWYPITERAKLDLFRQEVRHLDAPPTWAADVCIAGEKSGLKMRGCGMLVVNPPWKLDGEITPVLAWLASVLAQAPGAQGGLSWIVPER